MYTCMLTADNKDFLTPQLAGCSRAFNFHPLACKA